MVGKLKRVCESEAKRIRAAYDEHAQRVLAHVESRRKGTYDQSAFEAILASLSNALVNPDAYVASAQAGVDAVPDRDGVKKPDAQRIADVWVSKTKPHAIDFPDRLAGKLSEAAYAEIAHASEQQLSDEERDANIDDAIAAVLESGAYQAELFSEPPWGAGNQGYGESLDANDIKMDWDVEPTACPICEGLHDGEPYDLDALPMWPGDPHPNCRCVIQPDAETWQDVFGDAAE